MGSDSRVSDEGDSSIFSNKHKKIHQLKNKAIIGIAGDADYRAILDLFGRVKKLPTSKQIIALGCEFEALLYWLDHTLWYISSAKRSVNEEWYAQVLQITDGFTAIGSGAKFAIGALDRGATVEQAIKTAIKYDPACGGSVQLVEISKE